MKNWTNIIIACVAAVFIAVVAFLFAKKKSSEDSSSEGDFFVGIKDVSGKDSPGGKSVVTGIKGDNSAGGKSDTITPKYTLLTDTKSVDFPHIFKDWYTAEAWLKQFEVTTYPALNYPVGNRTYKISNDLFCFTHGNFESSHQLPVVLVGLCSGAPKDNPPSADYYWCGTYSDINMKENPKTINTTSGSFWNLK